MQRNEERFDRVVQLAAHPENETIPVLGVQLVDAAAVLEGYRGAYAYAPFVYLVPLPLLEQRGILVPFSDTMHPFYNSSLGAAFYPLANFLFWVWFVNLNVGLFNALPIYPLDGGQAFRKGLKALAGGRLTDASVKKLTAAVSVAVFLLIISLFFAPYLDLLQIRPPST